MVEKSINPKPKPAEVVIPPLRSDLTITEDNLSADRGLSLIIYDPVNGKYFRVQGKEQQIIPLLSKETTLAQLSEMLKLQGLNIDDKELLSAVNFLFTNSLLVTKYMVTENIIDTRIQLKKNTFVQRGLSSLLFLKIPIWNPDKFLDKTRDMVKALLNKWVIFALAILSISGYICAIPNGSRISAQFYGSLSYQGLIRYSLTIIILKVLHELAHAYTAKLLNVPIRKFGIFFIVFFPRLYTDLTDSWRIVDRKKRMLIDSAGILLEVIAGGIGALLWLNTGAGVLNSISYNIFAVGTISAILVNGNPFIKFDGYYLLMDYLNIDNLQKQSTAIFRKLVYRRFLGIELKDDSDAQIPGWKTCLLIAFIISSFIYRFFLYTGIILIIYFMFTKTLAIIFIFIEVYTLFVLPLQNEFKTIKRINRSLNTRKALFSSLAVLIVLLLFLLPLPWNIEAPCEVSSLETVPVYMPYEGSLEKIVAPNGKRVASGEKLLDMKNPFLEMDIRKNKVELEILSTEKHVASTKYDDLGIVKIKEEQMAGVKKNLSENTRKLELLDIRASIPGVFVIDDLHIRNGKWFRKGEYIGEVVNPDKPVVYAYVEEKDLSKIKVGDKAYITVSGDIGGIYGKVIFVSLVPSDNWKNSPLLNISGGHMEVLKQNPDGTSQLINNYYRLTIVPNGRSAAFMQGRSGTVKIRKYSSIAGNFFRFVLSMFQKEVSF